MEEPISRIIAELEELRHYDKRSTPQSPPLSDQSLSDLQLLLDDDLDANGSESLNRLYDELSSNNLSPSVLLQPIASSMDSSPVPVSILASKVYLSLLLAPNAPVFTLFTPMSFLSFLRSIRRSLKHRPTGNPSASGQNQGSQIAPNRKRKGGARGRVSKKNAGNSENDDDVGEESEFDVRDLFAVIERLALVLGLVHLDRFPDSLKFLVQTMAELPVFALESCGNVGHCNKLINLCLRVLTEALKPEHGDPCNTAAELLKSLAPLILMPKSQARTFALGIVTSQMMTIAEESDGVKKAITQFSKYLVRKAPDKAEPRALAVESIMEIVRIMAFEDQIGFVKYAVNMTQGKSNLRLLGVDLILNLLMSLKDPLGVDSEDEMEDAWGIWCLEALIQRCSDVIAAIRARALSNLAQLVGFFSSDAKSKEILKEFLGFSSRRDRNVEARINNLLRRRSMDDKAAVRKASLLLVTKLTTLLSGAIDEVVLKTMGMACSDPLVSMRKAAISALSEAFRTFSDGTVIIEWLHSVPRLITDNESSIQEECENLFLELVLDRISRAAYANSSYGGSMPDKNKGEKSLDREMEMLFPEGVLYLLREICNGEVAPWVKKICTNLGKKKRLKPKIITALKNIIRTSESIWLSHSMPIGKWMAPPGAWFLLSEVSAYLPKAVEWEFLHHHWQLLDKHEIADECKSSFVQAKSLEAEESIEGNSVAWAGDRVFLLQTISNVSVELPSEPAAELGFNLLRRIEEFNMHFTEIDAHVKALRRLCKRQASDIEEAETIVLNWAHRVFDQAYEILKKFISKEQDKNKESSFYTPPRTGIRKGKKLVAKSKALSIVTTAVFTVGSLAIVCPSAKMSTVVPLLLTIITSGRSSHPKSNNLPGLSSSIKQTAPSLYIQGWVTMGKLCLAKEELAKRYIALFIQELEKSESAALRINLVAIVADFCVRYTALVDCHISKITMCLCDPCELVRRQTFILISRLLQRDYVKWRGVLFLRFLLSLVDESEKIRHLADFLFENILKVKAPLLAYNSFVEAIFFLNDCHAHNGQSESHGSRTESRLFSIRGNDENSRSKRMHIYVSLLKKMVPEHHLATLAKICAEILASAADGILNIEHVTGQCVLQDAFQIIACKEIRISSTRASSSESADIEEEGGESAGASMAAAKRKVISQAFKKNVIQNTVPIFIELKRHLEGKNSPLIGSFMECLRSLLKDYKNEIDDILVGDKQLQKELIYDMQKYEAAKAKATVAEVVASIPKSTRCQSPQISKVLTKTNGQSDKNTKVASAIADAAATATVRSVLKEVNKRVGTPPIGSLSVPKVRSCANACNSRGERRKDVLESLRKRQSFDSDEEN